MKDNTTQSLEQLRSAIEKMHDCRAELLSTAPVEEVFKGETVWTGDVSTYRIEGNPLSDRCYAWTEYDEKTEKDRYYAVLRMGPVQSPLDAVRASLIKDHQDPQK